MAEKTQLPKEIRKTFAIPVESELIIQLYNDEWQDLVDVDDMCDLPDSCKLSVSVSTPLIVMAQEDNM